MVGLSELKGLFQPWCYESKTKPDSFHQSSSTMLIHQDKFFPARKTYSNFQEVNMWRYFQVIRWHLSDRSFYRGIFIFSFSLWKKNGLHHKHETGNRVLSCKPFACVAIEKQWIWGQYANEKWTNELNYHNRPCMHIKSSSIIKSNAIF